MPVILAAKDYECRGARADPGHLPVDLLTPFDAKHIFPQWISTGKPGLANTFQPPTSSA
jgi:hypothetical protein